jgi:predicted DsbA family dithiol-disulfide isomerase
LTEPKSVKEQRLKYIEALSTGHAVWTESFARRICEAFGVSFSEALVRHYAEADATGVSDNDLLCHLATNLGVDIREAKNQDGRSLQAKYLAGKLTEWANGQPVTTA